MSISRRGALIGAGAAAVVASVPEAVQASQTDPVAALVRKSREYEEWLNTIGGTVSDDEFDALVNVGTEMECRIWNTPSTSFEGIAGKVRLAWEYSDIEYDVIRDGPPEEFFKIYPLDSVRFIWSALQDLERLAGEARS